MSFLDDFGKTMGVVMDSAAAKTKEFTEITKLNMQISSEERKIEKLYAEIGKLAFEREKGNSASFASEQCGKILGCKRTISELEKKLGEAKNS